MDYTKMQNVQLFQFLFLKQDPKTYVPKNGIFKLSSEAKTKLPPTNSIYKNNLNQEDLEL